MHRRPHALTIVLAVTTALNATGPADALDAAKAAAPDLVGSEIARWSAAVKEPREDRFWHDAVDGLAPIVLRAEQAQKDGHGWLALVRLAFLQENLGAALYVMDRSAEQRKEQAAFESEWKRMGAVLPAAMMKPEPQALDRLRPAIVRAVGEAALNQVHVYYDASLVYGASTTPDSGLYYLGAAQAQAQMVDLTRRLAKDAGTLPRLRDLKGEIEALQHQMLLAYRPPVSIEKHREFITASAMLKEARELDAAGFRYGALLRYLQSVQRFAAVRPPAAVDRAAVERSLAAIEAGLAKGGADHTIGRFLVESARADLAAATAETPPAGAAAIVSDVFPRYFAALKPPPPAAPAMPARATVTLVRWPYT